MNERDYLEQRLEEQINWYDQKSIHNQKMYKRLRKTELILAASIPVIAGFIPKFPFFTDVVGIFGALIAIISGLSNLGKYHENWIEYRSVCETLRHEKYMYLTKTGVYSGDEPFRVLVERVESIISHENVNWAQLNNQNEGRHLNG
jgi:hypothetical protein